MKKVILTLVLAAFTFAANAQFVVGGQLGYFYNGGNINYTGVNNSPKDYQTPFNGTAMASSSYSIMPKIGYQLNDNMQVGLSFGIEGSATTDYSSWTLLYRTYQDFEGWKKTSQSSFSVAPYLRYNLGTIKGLTFFCEAQLSFTFDGKEKIHEFNTEIKDILLRAHDTTYTGNNNVNSISFSVVPGLNYKFNDRLSADLYIDLLRLSFVHTTNIWENVNVDGDKYVENTNNFYFGANLNAQTLSSQFSHFRLGFNYHF